MKRPIVVGLLLSAASAAAAAAPPDAAAPPHPAAPPPAAAPAHPAVPPRAAAPARRGVAWGWLSFPGGVSLRKVQEVPAPGASAKPGLVGLAYAVPADADPFEAKLVDAARAYLAAKYPSATRLQLVAWIMSARGDAVDRTQARAWIREQGGKWRTDPAPGRLVAPGEGVLLPTPPLRRDEAAEAAATAAMRAWLDALDRRDLSACWATAGKQFRGGLAEADWRGRAKAFADRLGTKRDRRELAREYGPLPEDRFARYVTIEFRTDYSVAGSVVEGLTAVPCDGGWCVTGWGAR